MTAARCYILHMKRQNKYILLPVLNLLTPGTELRALLLGNCHFKRHMILRISVNTAEGMQSQWDI